MTEAATEIPRARRRRWPWILAAFVVALPVAGFLALRAFVNPEALRPRLVAAVEQATGRRFTVGSIGLALSLRPTVELRDVALANAPGGSRPEMLTARRVEVQAALLPLLSRRVEIARVLVDAPDLLLETDAQGRGNWQFRGAEAPAPQATPAPAETRAPGQPLQVAVDAIRVEGGRVIWRGAGAPGGSGAGAPETLEIASLDAAAPVGAPVTLRGMLRLRGAEIALRGEGGVLSALGGAAPWPFDLTAELPGPTRLAARGALEGNAWRVQAEATLANLAPLAPLLPDTPLPPLRDVTLAGTFAGRSGDLTAAESLRLAAGSSDLSLLRPGLMLARLELTASRMDAPLTLAAEGSIEATPIRATGRSGTPAQLLGRAPGPLPVDLRVEAAGATALVQGQVRDAAAVAGVDLALELRAPDLAALAPLTGGAPPALRDLHAQARLSERTPGFQGGAHLRGFRLAAAQAEATGDVTLIVGERPGITGRIDVARLDLDALGSAPKPAAPPSAAPAPPRDGRVIPDLPLPVGALRGFDADLRLTVARLVAGGAEWRDIQAPIKLEAGRGGIAPFSMTTPGGVVTAELSANAAGATPALRLVLRAPRLDLAPLQQALGQPVRIAGRAELDADLRGNGAGLRQLAASLAGHLGIAMLDASVEPALLGPVQAALRQRVPVLPTLPQRLPVECVALRGDAEGGVMRIGTLLLDAPAAKVAGSGTVNLGTEAVALRMLHDVRGAGASLRVAADLGGTMGEMGYRGVQAQNLGEVLGGLAGRVGGDAGALLGALANRGGARPDPLPDCGPALAAARGGREGPVPAARPEPATGGDAPPAAAPSDPAARLPGPAGDLLRGFLRR